MKTLNKIFTYWRDDLFGSKSVPDYRKPEKSFKKPIREEYPYNIEFGDGRTKKEMDKMQKELLDKLEIDGC